MFVRCVGAWPEDGAAAGLPLLALAARGFPAVLELPARRRTRFTRCARFAQTAAASQFTKRASTRAAGSPASPLRDATGARAVQASAGGLGAAALSLGCAQVAPPPHRPRAGNERGFLWPRMRTTVSCKAVGGMRLGRIGAAEERRVPGRACTHALRDLICRRLFERSERSERSEFGDRPGTRAPQGTRSEAKGKPSEPRPHPTHRLARAD